MDRLILDSSTLKYLEELQAMMKQEDNQTIEVKLSFETNFMAVFEDDDVQFEFKELEYEDFLRVRGSAISDGYFLVAFKMSRKFELYDFIHQSTLEYKKVITNRIEHQMDYYMRMIILFVYVMNHYKKYQIVTEKLVKSVESVQANNPLRKSPNPTIKSKRTVSVLNKVIRITEDGEIRNKVNRAAKRKWYVDEFNRRGHYRTYKDGRQVWINPTKVRTGKSDGLKVDKDYKL